MEPETLPLVDTDTELHPQESNHYCKECLEQILIPKPKPQKHKYSSLLHGNLSDLIDCCEQCQLCSYICSLFGSESLSQIISNHSSQLLPVFVHYNIIEPNLDEDKVFDYADLSISVERELPSNYSTKHTVAIETRIFTICTSTARAFGRPTWSSPHRLDFDARSSTIREWIKECDTTHQNCRDTFKSDQAQAARILHVERLGSSEFGVKLVSTQDMNLHKERYFVLSHVWGDIDITCRTTTKNITRYLVEGVSYGELPQTFKDAVRITAVVGLHYIWIDSLCIIQDDKEDWQREAGKMASIYRAATLTISATSARNSLGGCGISAAVEPALQLSGCSKSPLGLTIRGPEYGKSREVLVDQMKNTVVPTRAWIFQEQILSLRTLHMAHSQFVWQCATLVESEDGLHYKDHRIGRSVQWPNYDRIISRLRPLAHENAVPDPYELDQRWWSWVDSYTSRDLKHTSDQYAALAGVVRFYQDIADDEPVVGLWRKNLPLHLLWRARRDDYEYDHKPALPKYGTRRPSWTWMTYPHGSVRITSYELDWHKLGGGPQPGDVGIVYQATTICTDISWSGEPLTSEPAGTIKIRGVVNQIARPSEPVRVGYQEHFMALDPEVPESIRAREKFHTIALVAYVQEGSLVDAPPFMQIFFLVIEPLGPDRCIRIGWMRTLKRLPVVSVSEYQPGGDWRDLVIE